MLELLKAKKTTYVNIFKKTTTILKFNELLYHKKKQKENTFLNDEGFLSMIIRQLPKNSAIILLMPYEIF